MYLDRNTLFAAILSTVSATVVTAVTINQDESGIVDVSGEAPVYCELNNNTFMCYY